MNPEFDTAKTPAQIEALVTQHVLEVPCAKCGTSLNGEPYRQERWKSYHVKCEPPSTAWRAKARRNAVKAFASNLLGVLKG